MKKQLLLLFVVISLLVTGAFAEVPTTEELSSMSVEDLLSLRDAVDVALFENGGKVILPEGELLVGRDIAAGTYTITPYFDETEEYTLWTLNVYLTADSKKAYEKAQADNNMSLLQGAMGDGVSIGSIMDSQVNTDDYFAFTDLFVDSNPKRVNLEDGQVLEVTFMHHDSSPKFTIEKAGGLFMD